MSIWDAQYAFTVQFEAAIPWLYLDARGNVTCAVGQLVTSAAECAKLPWTPSAQAAIADFGIVLGMEKGRLPGYYAAKCSARIRPADMRALFDRRCDEFERQIRARWKLPQQPECVRTALMDMAFQLGAGGLAGYVKLYAAVMARDWQRAADESFRHEAQPSRNAATRALFLQAT